MKIIDGIESLIGKDFTGLIDCVFDEECAINLYTLYALDGKLIFGNEDIKKHFITTMSNQELKSINFKKGQSLKEEK